MSLISLVVPVYNEQDSIDIFISEIHGSRLLEFCDLEIIFVNDGSVDLTAIKIQESFNSGLDVSLINLSRNFGKEAALFAGINYAKGDAVIPIDVDLQDPISVVIMMIKRWEEGCDIVLAKRIDRRKDTFLKRVTAEYFYKIHNVISEVPLEENVGDFRLISRAVIDVIKTLPERKVFMKGIFSWVGFDAAIIEYVRDDRRAGSTKFNGWKLWNLALEGFTSFSTVPLRFWTYMGFFIAVTSFSYAVWMVLSGLVGNIDVPGYKSLMTAILFFGGVQLIGVGVLGEYIGRIYMEVKQRPRYIIKEVIASRKS